MERGLLSKPEFKKFADKYVLFLHFTSYVEGHKYDSLLQDKDGRTFPTLMFMDAAGDVLTRDETSKTVAALTETSNLVDRFLALKQRAAKGGPSDKIDLRIAQCDLGQIEFYDLEEEFEGKKLSDEQRKAYLAQKANAAAVEQAQALRASRYSQDSRNDAGEEFLDLYREGAVPSHTRLRRVFWSILMDYAAAQKEDGVLKDAIRACKTLFAGDERMAKKIAEHEK